MKRFVKRVQTTLVVRVVEELVHVVGVRLNVIAVRVQTTVAVAVGDGSTKKHRRRITKNQQKLVARRAS